MAAEPTTLEAGTVRAAGAILWRPGPAGVQVALVHRPKYDDWSFPKGKAKSAEHILRTVRRELREETGATVRLGSRLPSVSYLKDGRPKRVDYWSAEVLAAGAFRPNDEIDEVRWASVPEALAVLSYEHDESLLRTWSGLPRTTRPVVVLRHASAGEKRFWQGADFLRPLDPRGRWEAAELAALLQAYAPLKLISSTTQRCIETMLPFAATGSPTGSITTDPHFTVGSPWLAEAVPHFRTLLREPHDGLLVCTHGELVPDLIHTLCAVFDAKTPEDPALRKGAFWVFHVTSDALVSLEHHAPAL
ncbi:NUDIX hydrolase [Actinocorallia longicatena]|uniref:NUDIX hydrolase n=1 Tax=Actinocorallia longicatena TaxID=111803 RepID=A0ABP6QK23_9ACTN